MTARAPSTARLYAAALEAFREWCTYRKVKFPPADHAALAAYLRECGRQRGPASARMHLSALANYYRSVGMPFDTRSPTVQAVIRPIRDRLRARGGRG